VCPQASKRLQSSVLILFLFFVAALGGRAQDSSPSKDSKKETAAPQEEVYEPGPAVKSPKLIHYVEPKFSPDSKEAFVEGVVKVSTVVTTEGKVSTCKVVSGLNSEEDRTALEALKKWTFQPGTKDGKPVNVRVTVEIEFHLM
jgi:periplasmic protein TonB